MVAVLGARVVVSTGLLLAVKPSIGIAAVLAVFYTPLAFVNLPAALVGWAPIPFIEHLPFVWVGPTFALLLIFFAWLGTLPAQRRLGFPALRGQRWAMSSLILMLIWFALSLAWAPVPGRGTPWLIQYVIAAVVVIIVMTTIEEPRHVRGILIAFVVGAAISVLAGFFVSGLDPNSGSTDEGRLAGGGGDPNYLAAGLVPAIVIAIALMSRYRHPLARIAMCFAIGIMLA